MFIRSLATLLVLTAFTVETAAAQTPAAPAQPAQPPAAPPPAPPVPGMGGFVGSGQTFWVKSLTIGGSFNTAPFKQGALDPNIPGLTGAALQAPGEMKALQTSLSILRATNLRSLNIEAGYTYAVQEPLGKVADQPRFSVDFDFRQKDGQRYFFLTRYAWMKDVIKGITHSHEAQAGIGALVVDQPKFKLGVVPVLGVMHAHKGLAEFDDRLLGGFGGIQKTIITPNPYVHIEQNLSYQQAFNDTAFRVIQGSVAVKGQVNKHLAVQFNITHKDDNVLAQAVKAVAVPGVGTVNVRINEKSQTTMTGGIQITF
jgi:hypothetical protein